MNRRRRIILGAAAATASFASACMTMTAVPPPPDLPLVTGAAWATRSATFDAGAGARVELRDGNGNGVLVPVEVNEIGPRWFILDTGAGRMLATEAIAREAALPPMGATRLQGEHPTTVFRAERVRVGPWTLLDVPLVGMNIANSSSAFGVEVSGLCGHDLFSQGVVEIDLASSLLVLHDPAAPEDTSLPWVPLEFTRRLPAVRCVLPQGSGLLVIDTGFAGGVQFTTNAIERIPSLATLSGDSRRFQGVGWSETVTETRIEWLEVGGVRFEDVPAAIPEAASDTARILGTGREGDVLGILGCDVLRRARVVLDYPRSRVAVVAHRRVQ